MNRSSERTQAEQTGWAEWGDTARGETKRMKFVMPATTATQRQQWRAAGRSAKVQELTPEPHGRARENQERNQ